MTRPVERELMLVTCKRIFAPCTEGEEKEACDPYRQIQLFNSFWPLHSSTKSKEGDEDRKILSNA